MIEKNTITYEPCSIEQLQSKCKQRHRKSQVVFSMRDFLAKKNANLIWGNDYTFEADDKILSAFNKFAKINRLPQLLKFVERELSLHGRAIIVMNKNKKGDIMLNIANPFFYTAIGKVFVTEALAVVWQRIIIGSGTYFVKSVYDTQKCENTIYDTQNQIVVFDQVRDIQELGIEPIWYHNLGFVPVMEITNYPLIQYSTTVFLPAMYETVADWYCAQFFEHTFYEFWKNLNKEVAYCHSRIGVESANQQLIEDLRRNVKTEGDFEDVNILGDYIIETETGAKVQAIPGVGDFTKYTSAMNEVMDFYFKFANSSRFSEGGGAQKTSAEANQSKSTTYETMVAKIKHREYEYSILFAKVLSYYGVMDYEDEQLPFTFKINGNIQRQENAFVDLIIKQVQAGLMSMVEAIAQLRSITNKDAQKIFESIKEFNEENDVMVNTMAGPMDEFDMGGRPTKEEENGEIND